MLRELNYRENDGVSVGLSWESESGEVVVFLEDARTGFHKTFSVPPESAMDAFDHPFCYLTEAESSTVERAYSVKA